MGDALITAGVVNGALIALVLLYRGMTGRNGVAVLIGAFVLTAVTAVVLIRTGAPLRMLEVALTLLGGVLVVMLTGRLVGRPPGLLRVGLCASIACLMIGAVDQFLGGDPVRPAVLAQMAFTAWAWGLYARALGGAHADRRMNAHRRGRIALAILIGVTLLHLAQALRLALPDHAALRSIVPLTIGLLFIAASAATAIRLVSARNLAPLNTAPAGPERQGPGDDPLVRLRAYLDENGRYARADAGASQAAADLTLDSGVLIDRLRGAGYAGWSDYLRGVRIDHARRQLADPAEARTSIDAIGLGCGFRSRSTFYQAFEREFGLTPGAYRARALAENVSG